MRTKIILFFAIILAFFIVSCGPYGGDGDDESGTTTSPTITVGYTVDGQGFINTDEQTPVSGTLTASDDLDPSGEGMTWSVPSTHDWTGDSLNWSWFNNYIPDSPDVVLSWAGSAEDTSNPLTIGTYYADLSRATDSPHICSAGTLTLNKTSGSTVTWTYTPHSSTDMLGYTLDRVLDRVAIVMTTAGGVSVTKCLTFRVNGVTDAPYWTDGSADSLVLPNGSVYILIEPGVYGPIDVNVGYEWPYPEVMVTSFPSSGYLYQYTEDWSNLSEITPDFSLATDYLRRFFYKPGATSDALAGTTVTIGIKLYNGHLYSEEKLLQYTYPNP